MIETDMAQGKRKEKKKEAEISNAHKYHTICCTRTIVPRPREESKCKSSTVMQSHNVGQKSNEDRTKSKKWHGEKSNKEEEGKKKGSKTKITFPALALRLALRTKSIFLRLLQARNPLRRVKRKIRSPPTRGFFLTKVNRILNNIVTRDLAIRQRSSIINKPVNLLPARRAEKSSSARLLNSLYICALKLWTKKCDQNWHRTSMS